MEQFERDPRLDRRRLLAASAVGVGAALTGLAAVGRVRATTEGDDEDDEDDSPIAGTPVGSAGEVTIYSGRNENLIDELIERFQAATGIEAKVRYGDSAELAAQILDEGGNSPADVLFAQDAGSLGAVARENRLVKIDDDLLSRVDARFRSNDARWIGVSGRARVAVYNTEQLKDGALPASILDLTDERWKGAIGWAPTNGSFQAFITALRLLKGEDGARAWLEGMKANEPVAFENNGAITRAVGAGELPVGLVNHYYLYEVQAEEGTTLPIANHFFAGGDPGSLVNVAGVGILDSAEHLDQARRFVDYLLTAPAQRYFAERTFEYPLIAGVETAPELKPLSDIESPAIDLSDLADLQGTTALMIEVGIL